MLLKICREPLKQKFDTLYDDMIKINDDIK